MVQAHPPGAINVQIYRLIKEWTAWDIARRAAFAFFGIFSGTEENPEFLQSIQANYNSFLLHHFRKHTDISIAKCLVCRSRHGITIR